MAAYAALASLSKTSDLSGNQSNSQFSIAAEEKIRSIQEYVIFLLSFLEDYPQKSSRWEAKMRDLAHETEDIIEQFMWQQSFYRLMKPSSVRFEEQLRKANVKIGLIAGEVMEERPSYQPPSPLRLAAAAGNHAVVGLHGDVMVMKDRLCGLASQLQVIPILGMGGIGKTTLARTLYDDSLIVEYFHIRVWITVSQEYSTHTILLGLVDAMNLVDRGEHVSRKKVDDVEMATKIYQNLKGRRYLIVMDDVWNTKVLDDVKNIFPDDDYGSRILLTTRLGDVAAYIDRNSLVHEMLFMSDSQSWDLLKIKVFGNRYCPSDLEDVGKEIARRCAGLPLAVVLVAGILSVVSKTRDCWEEIAKNVNPIVDRELDEILSLSYTFLPHHLRPCFLLIGGFQEDANICTSRLIKLWVGEGFLKHRSGCNKSLEEVADEYLEDLVGRNLVVVTSRKSNGKIKSCSLHDMVRALCIRKAYQEKFIHVMDGRNLPQGMVYERRISFSHSHIDKVLGPTIRTVLCFHVQNFPKLLRSHILLRALDVLGMDLKEIPSEVFDLYHLRYLALMGHLSIPSYISNLVNLQTLIIRLSSGKLRGRYGFGVFPSLPSEIWRLRQLRHLLFDAPYQIPYPLPGLDLPHENLQTLSLVANLVWNESILHMVPNVKRLGLTYTNNHEYNLHRLNDLHHLEKLEVIGYLGFSWMGKNPSFPSTLKKLTLVGGGFPWKDMAIVGSLPNLEVLKLLDNSCNGETWETHDGNFPRLKFLLIDDSHLCQWITQSKAFPTLKRIVLLFCWCLWEIPKSIGEIPTLELIEVDHCRKSLVKSANKIKEEQESYGNLALKVRVGHEEIQSCYKRMDPSSELEVQLKDEREEIEEMVEEGSAYLSSSSDALIGLDEDLMALKERLCGQSSKLQIIPIVGVDGIGKTALAKTLYNDPLITSHFDTRVWLEFSRDYGPPRLRRIFLGLVDLMIMFEEQNRGLKIDEPISALKVFKGLECTRYIIVIDDVWSKKVWDSVRSIFPDNDNGSRIILTSSVSNVAAYFGSSKALYYQRWLTDSQSWTLLKQNVFKNNDCPPTLETIGKEIARNCFGLPLLVVLVAGFLCTVKKARASWEEIAQTVNNLAVDRGSEAILSLIYTRLPHHLKPCLLHMGVFPEDERLRAPKLIKLWVAGGFVKYGSGCSKSVEEEAEENLEDLVKRNLVIVISRESNGKIKSCSLHDLVRGFCIRKALGEKFQC